MSSRPLQWIGLMAAGFGLVGALHAWDYEGHRIVNQLALASLPKDFPAFVQEPANAARIAFLAGEPDRWRNVADLPIHHVNGMNHYLDLEQVPEAGLEIATLSCMRYEFALAFAAGRAAHPENFPPIDPAKNTDHSREWPGFAPWTIAEYYGELKGVFSYLKVMEELGTPEDVINAKANAVYVMGVMGHYVGDIAQPLHTTIHHNGWVGENPHGYSRWPGIHSWIDGGFIAKANVNTAEIAPRVQVVAPVAMTTREDGRDPMFVAVMDFLVAQNKEVEPLYQLEKEKKLGHGKEPITPEVRAFIEGQLLNGGEMLGAIWLTAWREAGPDDYLRGQLLKQKTTAAVAAP